jgi:hypothetical protein
LRNNIVIAIIIALLLANAGVIPIPGVATGVDRVTYVFEKDFGGVPASVSYSLRKLNEQGIIATELEVQPENGLGEIPTQDRTAVEAAGGDLPILIVQSGGAVTAKVKAPTTVAQVVEATGVAIEEPK